MQQVEISYRLFNSETFCACQKTGSIFPLSTGVLTSVFRGWVFKEDWVLFVVVVLSISFNKKLKNIPADIKIYVLYHLVTLVNLYL